MSRPRACLLSACLGLLIAAPAAAAACPGADLRPTATTAPAVRAAITCETNAVRVRAGLPALRSERRLAAAGQGFATQMVAEGFFGHVGPGGATLVRRLVAYTGWRAIGENIAWGAGWRSTARQIVGGWMVSSGHRANILSPRFTELGIGVAPGTPVGSIGLSGTYVAVYGARSARTAARATDSGAKRRRAAR